MVFGRRRRLERGSKGEFHGSVDGDLMEADELLARFSSVMTCNSNFL